MRLVLICFHYWSVTCAHALRTFNLTVLLCDMMIVNFCYHWMVYLRCTVCLCKICVFLGTHHSYIYFVMWWLNAFAKWRFIYKVWFVGSRASSTLIFLHSFLILQKDWCSLLFNFNKNKSSKQYLKQRRDIWIKLISIINQSKIRNIECLASKRAVAGSSLCWIYQTGHHYSESDPYASTGCPQKNATS